MALFEIFGIHIHLRIDKLIINIRDGERYSIATQRIALAILGIPIMLYALSPQNNVLLFLVGLGVWWYFALFGDPKKMVEAASNRT